MLRRFTIFFVLLGVSSFCFSQKVGIVLSGGGAKGLAHVGMIRALEENGIPIDYVTGTSMGAIVGGLYAAGYSPDEMKDIFLSPDFQNWISGEIPPEHIRQIRQMPYNAAWVNVNFSLDKKNKIKINLPTNLVSPTQMDVAFIHIYSQANAKAGGDFDKLFVPFRCVATDAENSQEYVPAKGDLGQIIRASMTFPLYFKPIRIEGKLLFDGGIYNNFPADVMKEEFSPDYMIGGDVSDSSNTLSDDNVMSHLEYIIMRRSNYNVGDTGLVIRSHIKVASVIDFSNAADIIEQGYQNTLLHIDEIKRNISRRVDADEVRERRESFRADFPKILIDSLHLLGLKDSQRKYVQKYFFSGNTDSLGLEQFTNRYYEFASDPRISYTYPSLRYRPQSKTFDLDLMVNEKGNFSAGIGGSISSSPTDQIFAQISFEHMGASIISVYANMYAGRFYNSGYLCSRWYTVSNRPFYLEIDAAYNNWNYFRSKNYFVTDETPSYLVKDSRYVGGRIVSDLSNSTKIGIGVSQVFMAYNYYQTNSFSRTDTTDRTVYRPVVGEIFFQKNMLNRSQYASSGWFLSASTKIAAGKISTSPGNTNFFQKDTSRAYNFFEANIDYEQYFNIFPRFTLGVQGAATYSTRQLLSNYTLTMLQAAEFNPTPESMTLFMPQYRAHQFLAFGLKGVFHLLKNFDLRVEGSVFQPLKPILNHNFVPFFGNFFEERAYSASIIAVYNSWIGPISIAFNHYSNQKDQPFLNFVLNIGLVMFNPQKL